MIRGVGQNLLIAGHARIEDNLAITLTSSTKRFSGEYKPVLKRKFRDTV